MPISATGTSTTSRRTPSAPGTGRGFSLLELLVVVAIIGIFLGVAVLSTDLVSFDRKLEREASHLATRIKFTSEEGLMQSRDFGIVFYEEGYEFVMFEPGQGWLPTGGAGMESFRLEDDMAMRLRIDDREVVLEARCEVFTCAMAANDVSNSGDDADTETEAEEIADQTPNPQVMIFSTGEVTPFEIEFRRESAFTDPGYLLTVEFDGQTEVARDEV